MNFERVATGLPVEAVLAELDARPDLWNQHRGRVSPASPHADTDDIWVRFRDPKELTEPHHFAEPHDSTFYPAWDALPSLHPIIWTLMGVAKPRRLGGILITRIPAGKSVKPHHDRGGWHAEHHNWKAFAPLRSNDFCVNTFEDEEVVMRAGEAWRINNQVVHAVHNRGATERITLIPCMRTEF